MNIALLKCLGAAHAQLHIVIPTSESEYVFLVTSRFQQIKFQTEC